MLICSRVRPKITSSLRLSLRSASGPGSCFGEDALSKGGGRRKAKSLLGGRGCYQSIAVINLFILRSGKNRLSLIICLEWEGESPL